jgi:hypothetical protein
MVSRQDFLSLCFATIVFLMHYGRLATTLTEKLLAACAILSILDDVCTFALWTMK